MLVYIVFYINGRKRVPFYSSCLNTLLLSPIVAHISRKRNFVCLQDQFVVTKVAIIPWDIINIKLVKDDPILEDATFVPMKSHYFERPKCTQVPMMANPEQFQCRRKL